MSRESSNNLCDLRGQTAIVTGASKGLGRAIAETLAKAGARVGLIARTEAELVEATRAISRAGGEAFFRVCDVTDLNDLSAVAQDLPVPDIFINNAGVNAPQHFLDVDIETFDRLFGLNVRSAFFAAQAFARRMHTAGGRGVIVNMSSQAGHVGLERRSVYCATKHAIEGLTKTMAMELAPTIRVVAIAPTFVETPLTRPYLEEADFRAYVDRNLLIDGLASVDDVASAVLYLASPAARAVTGTSLRVDGGWTAH